MTVEAVASATLSERVAEEVRVVMARRLMRQSQLARQLGVTEQWLSVRLRGKQPIDLNDLEMIADALDVPPSDLLGTSGTGRPAGKVTHDLPVFAPTRMVSRPPNRPVTGHRDQRRPSLIRTTRAA